MADAPKVLTLADFAPMMAVEHHLRLRRARCPLRSCQESQAATGKPRCDTDLPVCAGISECNTVGGAP